LRFIKALLIAGRCCIVRTEFGQKPSVSLKNLASALVSKSWVGDNGVTNGIILVFLK